ncbi:hypothetical protein BJ508DRAFT_411447 [Ascobolus immersus RN42]|uniref:Uncharacterized protein n=1 Tax=Ascobolus immersus RN42 TaxID=1160509 RepID=A0A3N4IKA8_ASCIM|nr:hypothetical protein BJ508DRAFT_411447 [Ascobolus immersus RN42]
MAPSANLLRIPRYDPEGEGTFVLLRARLSDDESRIILQATENENAYLHKLSIEDIPKTKAKPYKGTPSELTALIRHGLLGPADPSSTTSSEDTTIAITAGISPAGCALTIRRQIGTIKQKIAAITIPSVAIDEAGVDLFDWCLQALSLREDVESSGDKSAHKFEAERERADAMKKTLEEVTEVKKEHEAALLVKFAKVLNEKKARIRELEAQLTDVMGGLRDVTPKLEPLSQVPKEEEVEEEEKPKRGARRTRATTRGRGKKATPAPRKGLKRTSSKMEPDSETESEKEAAKMDLDEDATDSEATASGDESDTRSTEDELIEEAAASDDEKGRDKVDEVIRERKKETAVPETTGGLSARERWELLKKGSSGTSSGAGVQAKAAEKEVKPLGADEGAGKADIVGRGGYGDEMDEDSDDDEL